MITFTGFIFSAGAGSILPDIDQRDSKISHLPIFNILSFLMRHIFHVKHRGLTHSLLFLAMSMMMGITLKATIPIPLTTAFSCGIPLGISSHILLDMLNGKGVQLLYPYEKQFSICDLRYNGMVEWLIGIGGSIISITSVYLMVVAA